MVKKIIYNMNGRVYSITRSDIYSAMCSSNECLSPKFNSQIEILRMLLERAEEEIITISELKDSHLKAIEDEFEGASKMTIENAVKAYHNYSTEMASNI